HGAQVFGNLGRVSGRVVAGTADRFRQDVHEMVAPAVHFRPQCRLPACGVTGYPVCWSCLVSAHDSHLSPRNPRVYVCGAALQSGSTRSGMVVSGSQPVSVMTTGMLRLRNPMPRTWNAG